MFQSHLLTSNSIKALRLSSELIKLTVSKQHLIITGYISVRQPEQKISKKVFKLSKNLMKINLVVPGPLLYYIQCHPLKCLKITFFSPSYSFLIEGMLGSKTYLAKVDGSTQKPKVRPRQPFWGLLAAILDF